MRWLLLVVACLGGAASSVQAAEPEVDVYCPAVSFDNYDERGRNGPSGPHPVVLMVVGKIQKPAAAADPKPKGKQKDDDDPFETDDRSKERQRLERTGVELLVERTLFGSPPGKQIHVVPDTGGRVPDDAERVSYVYGLTSSSRGETPTYSLDSFYSYDRTFPLAEERAMQALARARLDLLVLGSKQIFIGRPAGEQLVVVERELQGDLAAGEKVKVGREHLPIPLSGDGPWIYFIRRSSKDNAGQTVHEPETRWDVSAVETVLAALKRRGDYPIRERVDERGRKERNQEILFSGSRSEAIELFKSKSKAVEILAARRLIHDGQEAIADVVAAIERNLWRESLESENKFGKQMHLIRVLAILEKHRTDGEVVRLIDSMLTKAEAGATFPVPPGTADDKSRPRGRYYNQLGTGRNHSLAWLLLTLSESEAARLFGERLMKLRDLAQYGWKDEAQFVLDASHLEDHLELARVEAGNKGVRPIRWPAGFPGSGLENYKLCFSPDGKWFAAVGDNGKVWSTADWTLAGEFKQPASVSNIAFSPDGKSLFVAGGGSIAILDRWDWRAGNVAQRYPGHESAINAMQLSRDGHWLFTSHGYYKNGLTLLFDTGTGKAMQRFPDEGWYSLVMHPSGKQFLGLREREWFRGETNSTTREKLPFLALDVAWAGDDRLWSLEEPSKDAAGSPGSDDKSAFKQPDAEEPESDPFTEPAQPTVLRQRRLDKSFSILAEHPLRAAARSLLISTGGKTVVTIGERQVETFAAPDWKSSGAWQLPKPARESRRNYCLSPDGRWLAVGEAYAFPRLFDARSGKVLSLGSGHSDSITALDFSANSAELRTQSSDGEGLRWNAASGKPAQIKPGERALLVKKDDWRGEELSFKDEEGQLWAFQGSGGGAYGPPSAYEIRVGAKKEKAALGSIEPNWGQHEPLGLVPGGKYLFVGTHIYSREDLKLVSSANVSGEIEQLVFSADGLAYALVMSEVQWQPSPLGIGVTRRHVNSQRLRVHDTRTGKTLFSIPASNRIRLVALSPDRTKLAAVNDRQEVEVWPLGR